MEFVEGQDLVVAARERKVTPEERASRSCARFAWLWKQPTPRSVIHRDLKPQNIMMERSGRVCVMDFGLARSMEAHRTDANGRGDGNARLHVAGAGQGHARGRAIGPLLARYHLLRTLNGRGAVQGGYRVANTVEAHPRPPPTRPTNLIQPSRRH